MKIFFTLLLLLAALLLARASRAQSVGIGTATPSIKAALEIQSPAKNTGLLIPRLTAGQRAGIVSPPQGLMVYQTDGTTAGGTQTGFWYYTGTGGWLFLSPTGDNLGNHTATQDVQLGTNQLVGNGGTLGLNLTNTGDARLGKTISWQSAADDRVLRFGDAGYVTVGETDGDDLLRLRAKNFAFLPSTAGYAGSVGIGTGGPTATLDVARGTAPDGAAVFRGTDRVSHFSYATAEDTYIRGGKATSNVLLNDNGGNVGVGTAAPLSRLSITPSAVEPKITLYDGGNATNHYGFGVSGGQLNYHVGSTSDTHIFYAGGKNGNGTELVRIKGNGTVGIGTTTPFTTSRLHAVSRDVYNGLFVNLPTTALASTQALHGEVFTTQNITDAIGVFGQAISGAGGDSGTGGEFFGGQFGAKGLANSDNGIGGRFEGQIGTFGVSNTANNVAAYGIAGNAGGTGTGMKVGVYGIASGTGANYAGYFAGNVYVGGTLSKAGGTFRIDHPQDPENKYLVHSFVESPEMLNVYRGHVTTDAQGRATATLPAYFEAENAGFEYVLTAVGQFAQAMVAGEVRSNQFIIATDKPNARVSWQVTGARRDKWALANPINPEEPKKAAERGHYLLPELYGRPASEGIVPPPAGRRVVPMCSGSIN